MLLFFLVVNMRINFCVHKNCRLDGIGNGLCEDGLNLGILVDIFKNSTKPLPTSFETKQL